MDEPTENTVSIGTMSKAYNILSEHGYERFRRYVAACDMGTNDIEACINKHKYATEPEFRDAINQKCKYIKDKWGIGIKV